MTEIEFPMYFSLGPDPGYNISYLETCGVGGEWELFHGNWTDSAWVWGGNCSIKGKLDSLVKEENNKIYFSEDILAEAKLDVLEVFDWVSLEMRNTDEIDLDVVNMTEMKMMIETRPRYPSDKITFTIADITKDRDIRFFNIGLKLNRRFDVDVVLEDSKRNFLNSIISDWLHLFH